MSDKTLLHRTQDAEETWDCPKCGADWRGKEIDRDALAKDYHGHRNPCERKQSWDLKPGEQNAECTCPSRFYSRLVGVEYSYDHPDHYDGTSEWCCPDCGTRWSRWTGKELAPGESAGRPR